MGTNGHLDRATHDMPAIALMPNKLICWEMCPQMTSRAFRACSELMFRGKLMGL
jgi:hypothetical protein